MNGDAQGQPRSRPRPEPRDSAGDRGEVLRRDEIDPGSSYVAPSGTLQTRLAEIWQEALSIDKIGTLDNFFELGGDSLQAVELFLRVEREFGVALPISTIIDHPTVTKLAVLLNSNTQEYAKRILVPLQSEGSEPPLYFIHEASGNLLGYNALVRHLGPTRKIFGLLYPGQDETPLPAFSIPELATTFVNAVSAVQPEGLYFLVGYSFGGKVAYEMARQLRERGHEIGLLVLIDTSANDGMMRGPQRVMRDLSHHLALMSEEKPSRWFAYAAGALRAVLRPRSPEEHDAAQVAGPDRLRISLDAAFEAYTPLPYDGAMKLFRCLYSVRAHCKLRHFGWAHHAKGGVEVIDLPADHSAAISEPIVALVAAHMRQWLKG